MRRKHASNSDGAEKTVRDIRRATLNDNGSSYISGDVTDWLDDRGMRHVRGAPHHPQTQGKIKRWHQTLKKPHPTRELLPAGRPRKPDRAFLDHYNNRRYHGSGGNVTPADVYFGRDAVIIERRKKIKKHTMQRRRLLHQQQAA
jgi:putative transposase